MTTLYENYNTGDNDSIQIYGVNWGGQTFTPTAAHTITSVKLLLCKYAGGSPGTVTVSIRETNVNGEPTGNDLCSGTTNGNTLTEDNAGEWREIAFGAGYPLLAKKYAIICRATAGDSDNYIRWRRDTSLPTYTGGSMAVNMDSGVTWILLDTSDMMFEDYGTPPPNSFLLMFFD